VLDHGAQDVRLRGERAQQGVPAGDRSRGGFWSLSMYDQDYYMQAHTPNGRTNVGTVSLEADPRGSAR